MTNSKPVPTDFATSPSTATGPSPDAPANPGVAATAAPPQHRVFAPWPVFADDEVEAAVAVLRSGRVNYWTGEQGREFEQEFAAYCGCAHGIALANGTLALELALRMLGVGAGDEVVVPSRTFIATASATVVVGARPVVADVDPDSGTVTAETIAAVLTPRTRAIIPVHLAGWPCDMPAIMALARSRGLKVIEDCAQAHGARIGGRSVGSFGDAAAFSFCQDKILTTAGEGGLLTTNDTDLWKRAWSFKDHGKSLEAVYERKHPPGFRWLHESFGSNMRLSEIQAAVGRVALRKLPGWVEKRRQLAQALITGLSAQPALRVAIPPGDVHHAYYKFYAYIRPERLRQGWSRDRVMHEITTAGVPCFSGSCSEIYQEQAFSPELRPAARLPVAQALGETSLMFLVHPTLELADMDTTCRVVAQVLAAATADPAPAP